MAAQRKTNGLKDILNRGMQKVAEATAPDDNLNALDLLTAQHRSVEKLFAEIEQARGSRKQALFDQLADQLGAALLAAADQDPVHAPVAVFLVVKLE